MNSPLQPSSRLLSLDVFRGLTIAGMVVVNDPGDWAHVYAPLRHAPWHGITPTDLVFPFFLFIVGVSVVLAYSRRKTEGQQPGSMLGKVFRRSAMIFGLGILLTLIPDFNFSELRIPGVLQRIALVFLACSLLFFYTTERTQRWIAAGLLLGYWLLMAFLPVPIDEVIREALATGQVMRAGGPVAVSGLVQLGDGFIAGNFEPGTNLQAWLDRLLVPGRLYEKAWDPEGLFSTLPSIATGLLGMMAGWILLSKDNRQMQAFWLLLLGFAAMTIGNVWDWVFPFNKNLWSSSFVMYTAGLASMTLGVLVWLLDVKGWKSWIFVPQVFGANAITAYVIHGTIGDLFSIPIGSSSVKGGFMDGLEAIGPDRTFVSLLWALLYTAIVFVPVWWMYRRKIFVKL